MSSRFQGRRGRRPATYALLIALALAATSGRAGAQHQHATPGVQDTTRRDATAAHAMAGMMDGPLGLSHERMGSGTSWMPDSSPMHATHRMVGDWTAMLHGVAFGEYDHQGGPRGASQFGIIDWEMLMLMRNVGSGKLHLHGMASLEPLTLGGRGYPLLLQSGESYQGQPLHDRQHPHDFIMELAAMFQQPVARDLALEVYGGLAGEPALGPVAFMHRPSAQNDPFAPLGHHWQDATHISYGVATAGVYSRAWKLEGSWFNGREPDENRWDLDLRRLDSWSGRLTVNPTGRLSLAGWYGYLPSPEALHPDESVHRYGASVLYGGRGIGGGAWGSMLLWGANERAGHAENSVAAETNLEIGQRHAVFGRAEYVRKSAEDLVLAGIDPAREFDVGSLVGGYVREVVAIPGGTIGVGGRVSVNLVPAELEPFYGSRTPAGIAVYVRIRPKRMASDAAMPMDMHAMPGMEHGNQPMPMAAPGDTHPAMPAMPGMKMDADTGHAKPHDMPGMPGMHDMHDMHDMPGMPMPAGTKMTKDTTPRAATTRTPSARPSTTVHRKASAKAKAKASTTQKQKAKSTPKARRPARMPGMSMPGMRMPGDSVRPPKP